MMNEWILQHEVMLRLGAFIAVFVLVGVGEMLAPRRVLSVSKLWRWSSNLGIVILNSVILRLLFPLAALGVAAFAAEQGWGLLNYYTLPLWLAVLLSVVALDLVIYLQHVMVHAVPALWRLHRVHHADLDYDLTTGARFHPLEIILSLLIKFAAIVVLGPPLVAVVIFEVLLNVMAMFNHGNLKLPLGLDRVLRWLVVTPDMHRVHHSIEANETNSNYGFSLSCWDRVFGTYIDQPRAGHEGMTIGLDRFRDEKQVDRLPGMLMLPFVGDVGQYPINRRAWDKSKADGGSGEKAE